jgi:hypothetical protein
MDRDMGSELGTLSPDPSPKLTERNANYSSSTTAETRAKRPKPPEVIETIPSLTNPPPHPRKDFIKTHEAYLQLVHDIDGPLSLTVTRQLLFNLEAFLWDRELSLKDGTIHVRYST